MDGVSSLSLCKRLVIPGFVLLLSCGCHRVKEPVSRLDITDVATSNQLLSGFWWIESDSWRWTAREFSAALQPPEGAEQRGATLNLRLYIPDDQVASLGPMTLAATIEGQDLQPETYSRGGTFVYSREIPKALMATSILPVRFSFDKALPAFKGDGRELGAIVTGIELQTN
jgi:hypothetical protein